MVLPAAVSYGRVWALSPWLGPPMSKERVRQKPRPLFWIDFWSLAGERLPGLHYQSALGADGALHRRAVSGKDLQPLAAARTGPLLQIRGPVLFAAASQSVHAMHLLKILKPVRFCQTSSLAGQPSRQRQPPIVTAAEKATTSFHFGAHMRPGSRFTVPAADYIEKHSAFYAPQALPALKIRIPIFKCFAT